MHKLTRIAAVFGAVLTLGLGLAVADETARPEPAAAAQLTCTAALTQTPIVPNGQTNHGTVTVNVAETGHVGVRGVDNAAWVINFSLNTAHPNFGSWQSIGGVLTSNVKLVSMPILVGGGITVLATRAFVLGSDGNTYYKTYFAGSWSGWYAHSVGSSYFNSLGNQGVETWSGAGYDFIMVVGQFWTVPTAACQRS